MKRGLAAAFSVPSPSRPTAQTRPSDHGPGHSPAVIGGTVYVNFDGSEGADGQAGTAKGAGSGAALVAFDAATGAKKWAVERKPYRASYSTPFLHQRPGLPAEVVVGERPLDRAVQVASGHRAAPAALSTPPDCAADFAAEAGPPPCPWPLQSLTRTGSWRTSACR